jgi:ParB-like chromosome segregation protein Spo0J
LNLFALDVVERASTVIRELAELPEEERIEAINALKLVLHEVSPFKGEPVDCVIWVKVEEVEANDYNPNSVAPPEMKLLEHSIAEDGYTQPVVTWVRENHTREVVDGFHRNQVGRTSKKVRARTRGYLPVTTINQGRQDRGDRIAATIRHNRARGKHQVQAMSEIVVELARRNWSDERIGRELGMDADEVLRLKQISGLVELFAEREFSEAWEVDWGS